MQQFPNIQMPEENKHKNKQKLLQRLETLFLMQHILFSLFLFLVSCLPPALKLAITSATDAYNKNATDADSQQFITSYQRQMSENLTAVEYAPLIAPLVSNEQHDNDDDNELLGNSVTAQGLSNNVATVTTVMPVSNGTQTIAGIIATANIQTANLLQRNATVSRDQLNSRAVIKSPSPSAMANNNSTVQKQPKPDAPMLNYIFDSHLTNKHRHYDPRYVSYIVRSFTTESQRSGQRHNFATLELGVCNVILCTLYGSKRNDKLNHAEYRRNTWRYRQRCCLTLVLRNENDSCF